MTVLNSERWSKLDYHPVQHRLWTSKARFRIVPAGRRSGKTELAIRYLITKATTFTRFPDGWFVFAAPTTEQAHDIYWEKVKRMVPKRFIVKIHETRLTIELVNGAKIGIRGLDKPARIEGRALDGIVMDEYGNMKADAWEAHIEPALSTRGRLGWAWLIGVPEGRNHYFDLYEKVTTQSDPEWEAFTWKSADILDPKEIESKRARMDPILFAQEYEASFVTYTGQAYHSFSRAANLHALNHMPHLPLIFMFDFNVSPGIALVAQEQPFFAKNPKYRPDVARQITAWIGEVHIEKNSTTEMVCKKLIADWKHHRGTIFCYGDPTGGNRHCSNKDGESNWDIIRAMLRAEFTDVRFRVDRKPPDERPRINCLNAIFKTIDGTIHGMIDPSKCREFIRDLDAVRILKGSDGALDKKSPGMEKFTHMTDAAGYFAFRAHNPYEFKTKFEELLV